MTTKIHTKPYTDSMLTDWITASYMAILVICTLLTSLTVPSVSEADPNPADAKVAHPSFTGLLEDVSPSDRTHIRADRTEMSMEEVTMETDGTKNITHGAGMGAEEVQWAHGGRVEVTRRGLDVGRISRTMGNNMLPLPPPFYLI